MARIYTKSGDQGKTSLVSGERVLKNHIRVEAYGTVDELNASIGLLISMLNKHGETFYSLTSQLLSIQHQLFDIGAQLSAESNARFQLPELHPVHIEKLEKAIDEMQTQLPELKQFILPGGSMEAAQSHVARCVCRRAERNTVGLTQSGAVPEQILIYLNRLSDYLFVLSRKILFDQGIPEVVWKAGS